MGNSVAAQVPPKPFPLPEDRRLFELGGRFPDFDAAAVAAWLAEMPASDRPAAHYALSRRWLNLLIPAMRAPHAISESTNFLLLSVPKVDPIKRVLQFLEETRARVLRALVHAGPPRDRPKHLVVIFGDRDDYAHFTAAAAPEEERELAESGGMFIPRGVPHIVLPSHDLVAIHPTLVHELIHDCVAHLPLPAWLNEGITQMLEYDLVSWSPFELNREMMEKHADYWTPETIQDFWSGRSFHLPGDAQKVSYNLAVVLVRQVMNDYGAGRDAFWRFVRDAQPADAGDRARREHVGIGLSELVAGFLWEENWAPRPR